MSKMFKAMQYTNILIQMFGFFLFIAASIESTGNNYESAINSFMMLILTGIFSIAGTLMGTLYFSKYRKRQSHAKKLKNDIISAFQLTISFTVIGLFLCYIPKIAAL